MTSIRIVDDTLVDLGKDEAWSFQISILCPINGLSLYVYCQSEQISANLACLNVTQAFLLSPDPWNFSHLNWKKYWNAEQISLNGPLQELPSKNTQFFLDLFTPPGKSFSFLLFNFKNYVLFTVFIKCDEGKSFSPGFWNMFRSNGWSILSTVIVSVALPPFQLLSSSPYHNSLSKLIFYLNLNLDLFIIWHLLAAPWTDSSWRNLLCLKRVWGCQKIWKGSK